MLQEHYAVVLLFILFGIFFANLALIAAKIFRPKSTKVGDKGVAFECGELPKGSAWVRFNIRFYLIALFFIIFDVEVIFIYPWATVFKQLYPQLGFLLFVEMMVFLAVLVLGLIYVWAKGDLDWVKTLVKRQESKEVTQ